MQSLSRAIRRGNAVITHDSVTKQSEIVYRKGTDSKTWNSAVKNAAVDGKNIETIPFFAEQKPFKCANHEKH